MVLGLSTAHHSDSNLVSSFLCGLPLNLMLMSFSILFCQWTSCHRFDSAGLSRNPVKKTCPLSVSPPLCEEIIYLRYRIHSNMTVYLLLKPIHCGPERNNAPTEKCNGMTRRRKQGDNCGLNKEIPGYSQITSLCLPSQKWFLF